MIKAIRYTLAAICLTASVGCLALWWLSLSTQYTVVGTDSQKLRFVSIEASYGMILAQASRFDPVFIPPSGVTYEATPIGERRIQRWQEFISNNGRFGGSYEFTNLNFPLWYPALVFALAAVAAIRIRRFTLRSALVGIGVVAALLGMVVQL